MGPESFVHLRIGAAQRFKERYSRRKCRSQRLRAQKSACADDAQHVISAAAQGAKRACQTQECKEDVQVGSLIHPVNTIRRDPLCHFVPPIYLQKSVAEMSNFKVFIRLTDNGGWHANELPEKCENFRILRPDWEIEFPNFRNGSPRRPIEPGVLRLRWAVPAIAASARPLSAKARTCARRCRYFWGRSVLSPRTT